MKKNIKRAICSLLCLSMLPVSVLAGCKKDKTNTTDSSNVTEVSAVEKVRYTDGVHVLTAPETDQWFVKDGKTEYKILMPESINQSGMFAKSELLTFFKEATGIALSVETESGEGKQHSSDAKYISIGKTKMLESSGIEVDYGKLGRDGVRIVTKDSTVYITGGDGLGGESSGVLNGIYDFLKIYFNFEWFYHDCYTLERGVTDLKLRAFDVTDIPDVEWRMGSTAYVNYYGNVNNSVQRFRYNKLGYGGSYGVFVIGHGGHNSNNLIEEVTDDYPNYGDYVAYKEKFLSDAGEQLCYTAHGDATAYEVMVDTIAERFKRDIMAEYARGSGKIDYSITIEDNPNMCTCAACKAETEKYGSNTGSIIKLCNAVMHEVKDVWMESEEGAPYKNEAIRCCLYAYNQAIDAPNVKMNEATGKYEVVNEELKFRDDVGVWICFSKPHSVGLNLYAKENDAFREFYAKWADIASYVHIWGYQANFQNYIDFVNTYDFYDSDLYQFCVAKGVGMWFGQHIGLNAEGVAFAGLKEYLQSQFQWDCTQDTETLMNKWFNAMFGEAASIMREMFEYSKQVSMQMRHIYNPTPKSNSSTMVTATEEKQPLPVLQKKMAYCDKALELVSVLYKDSDPVKYEQLKFHIDLEWFSPAYHLRTIHGLTALTKGNMAALSQRIYEVNQKMGKVTISEGNTADIKTTIEGWVS